jgi:hypothetical protein
MKRVTRHSILILLLIAVLPACLAGAGHDGGLARVDALRIAGRQLDLRMAVERAYGNEYITREAALIALVNDVVALEVAKQVKRAPTREDIDGLSRHADKHSKAPEILAKVKGVFGEDRAAYERLYLTPKVVNHKLHRYHGRNRAIHASQATLIEQAHGLVMAGGSFKDTAKGLGLQYATRTYGDEKAKLPAAFKKYFPEDGAPQPDPLIALIEALSEGRIYPNIIEHDRAFQVLRLLEKKDAIYDVETITVAKKTFQKWFEGEASSVKISILDPDLAGSIASKYPHLWWVKKKGIK